MFLSGIKTGRKLTKLESFTLNLLKSFWGGMIFLGAMIVILGPIIIIVHFIIKYW